MTLIIVSFICLVSSLPWGGGAVMGNFEATGQPCTQGRVLRCFLEVIKNVIEIKGAAFNVSCFFMRF
jgi:hypothetical protein